jgi:hypothetical protein
VGAWLSRTAGYCWFDIRDTLNLKGEQHPDQTMLAQLIQSEGPKELYPDHWPQVVMIERLLPRFMPTKSKMQQREDAKNVMGPTSLLSSAARPGLQQPVVMPSARASDVHRLMNRKLTHNEMRRTSSREAVAPVREEQRPLPRTRPHVVLRQPATHRGGRSPPFHSSDARRFSPNPGAALEDFRKRKRSGWQPSVSPSSAQPRLVLRQPSEKAASQRELGGVAASSASEPLPSQATPPPQMGLGLMAPPGRPGAAAAASILAACFD